MPRTRVALLALALSACAHAPAPPPPAPRATAAPVAPTPKPSSFGATDIDAALKAEWQKQSLTPAPRADDATFLRRTYVDVVGTVPPADVAAKFIADTAEGKRAKLVETLLASPDYADHWTNYWDDVLMGRETKGNLVDRVSFRQWLKSRVAANTPWDKLATELLTATGQNGTGGPKAKGAAMSMPLASATEPDLVASPDEDAKLVNGAVNWTLKYDQDPQDFGGSASRVFLGVQIQCAQCHDHKTEAWKQDDFRRFAAAFLRSRTQPKDDKAGGSVRRVVLEDLAGFPPRFAKKADLVDIAKAKPTALDGTDLAKGEGTRKALAAWMTAKKNPWFAKAFVNRMWGHFLGRGFIDPIDDMRVSNPATMPELLDRITADFIAHDFDVKYLVRLLCATEAYQLAATANAKTDPENKLWARFHLVPLGPEELLNAVFRATDLEHTAQKLGVKNMEALRANVVRQYAFLFDTDEEMDEPDYSGTVSQALTLLNGALVAQGARALPGSVTADLVNGPGTDPEKVDALALRALGRHATTDERARWSAYVVGSGPAAKIKSDVAVVGKNNPLGPLARKQPPVSPKAAAYEDLLWSMLNSSEFNFNH